METELLLRLGERVRERRSALALTLREVAARAGVSQRFLVSLEAGKANVSVVKLEQIARALATSAAALLAGEAAAPPPRAGVVALLGLRGAGKSAIGRRAAERLGADFVELDALVAERAGMSLESVFALHGADYYRRLEREELERFLAEPRSAVLATGGSLVTSHATFDLLRGRAVTVWLKATPQDHWDRVVAQGDARPMANREGAMQELRAILRARRPLYEQADHVIDTSALGLARSVDALVRLSQRTGASQ